MILSRFAKLFSVAVLVLAVLMAVLSLVMVRPDQDDVFVVNRSAYVEAHAGAFPERDTIFSDEVLPVERPAVLPTSIEPLVGTVAARMPFSAAARAEAAAAAPSSSLKVMGGSGATPAPKVSMKLPEWKVTS